MAFPNTYFEIWPSVSADKVTVTVGEFIVLFATSEIGIVASFGAKSSKKQFVFCANSDVAQNNTILKVAVILSVMYFIFSYGFDIYSLVYFIFKTSHMFFDVINSAGLFKLIIRTIFSLLTDLLIFVT